MDNGQFRDFYEAHSTTVYNTALSILQNPEEAEEVTQDVFIQCLKSEKDFRGDASIKTWIYRITTNKCLDQLRKRKSNKLSVVFSAFRAEKEQQVSDFLHPGIKMENREASKELFKAIDKLSDSQKTAFVLSFIEELPRNDVADIMDLNLKAVESLLQRAKQNLRKTLGNFYSDRRK